MSASALDICELARRLREMAESLDEPIKVSKTLTVLLREAAAALSSVRAQAAREILEANASGITAGRAEALEDAAQLCRKEAEACLGDIVPGDDIGAKLAHARAGALLAAEGDIRAINERKL